MSVNQTKWFIEYILKDGPKSLRITGINEGRYSQTDMTTSTALF